jgi:hypothetical protein
MFVPSGVTPPPIISAMEPVTTTAGRSDRASRRRAHGLLGAVLAELFLAEPGDDDGQLVRRQRVGVVQHG